MKLLIVESPAKIKSIAAYLGSGWQVEASFGHIRDLPIKEMGVAAPDYEPKYVTGERSGKTVAKLKKLAQSANEVWLATDPDREGEAIAWHLGQLLGHGKTVRRVTFNEITASAVNKAVANPGQINQRLFYAQQGRRVLDRLFGYKVSPVLGNKLGQRGVSAGRVQSVALRLIVEREQAIRNFVKTTHYGVKLDFVNDGVAWSARWDTTPFVSEQQPYIIVREIAERVKETALSGGVIVKQFTEKQSSRKPPAPFTTSTLQQAASNLLKLSVDATMKAAQQLFEQGLITYHRTDNPNLSQDGIEAIWALLRERNQHDYIPDKPNTWKAKGDAQEAHEAIRPTEVRQYKAGTGDEQLDRLYNMIWRRAVASQMKSAVFKVRSAVLATTNAVTGFDESALFKASSQEMIFDGWMKLSKTDYTAEEAEAASAPMPKLTEGQTQQPTEGHILELETKPPRRYSEPALVRALEREGIGRPSTYASIITVLKKRDYVSMVKRLFEPTELGEAIVEALKNRFSFMEISYTKEMEEALDAIAQGTANYQSVVAKYDQQLDQQLGEFEQDNSIATVAVGEQYPCPDAQCSGLLRRIKGGKGHFWGCSNYKDGCKQTLPDAKGKPGERQSTTVSEADKQYQCGTCQTGYLRRIKGSNGYFWGCSNFRDGCKHTQNDKDGKPELYRKNN